MMGGAVLVSVHLIDDSSSTWSSGSTLALKAETYKINKLVLKNNTPTAKKNIHWWHYIQTEPCNGPNSLTPFWISTQNSTSTKTVEGS